VPALPRSARFACWFTAWVCGRSSLDDARDAIVGADAAHDVVGLDDEPVPLVLALGRLRGLGAQRAVLTRPVPGDLVGLGGPPAFNVLALDAGEAVVLEGGGRGLVPSVVGAGVTWQVADAQCPRSIPDLAEADAELRAALVDSSQRLAELDVPRWRPAAEEALRELRSASDAPLAPGYPARAQRLAALSLRCEAITALALDDDGGAVSAYEAEQRRAALRRLSRSARHALVAACSAPGDPLPTR
jgi:hypothetical protein